MQKHLLRITLALLSFELLRNIGGELPALFRGQPAFNWFRLQHINPFTLSGFFIFALYTLSSFIILYKYFAVNRKKALLLLIVAVFCIITIRYCIEEVFFLHAFGIHNYFDNVPLLYYYVDNLYFAVLYTAFGVIYFFIQNEHKRKLEHQQLQLEHQQTQLSFLQSQVNPHFLFNSLNNIYALIYQQSPRSLDAVARLSDILRYMLYDSNEKVSLQKEWDYIQKYIELQLLRFDFRLIIEQQADGDLKSIELPPFILIPFVENAFKHGNLTANPFLQMRLTVSNNCLHFFIQNNKGDGNKDATGGIGLDNIKKRLQLLYPQKHFLTIKNTSDSFTADLKLNYE